ncbi:catechol 1,2-dioxygenase [Lentzea sp. HUAS12]|uniref:dioxygenase family protein n=1 Tax=Lentzea sp. HUAS12 TaxID=2951806 RepID=UPI00209D3EF8|nr:catechol 1,2-dioxygenase [Lentzea sp. HUAS12]USX55785.1 catechol 1,2-dioxygenase [Lentzea sp. HUAS12]
MSGSPSRVRVVFGDLRRAVDDVLLRHQVTREEMLAALAWLQAAADAGELALLRVFFYKTVLKGTVGAPYAHPEKDGASHWDMEGSAYRPGAPVLASPAVLPMRPDEPGEPLVVSGTVRTTTGEPLPGAALEIWQIDANNVYSGIDTSDFLPLNIPNDSSGVPEHNLRATVVADADGRYEFRTVMPGVETLGLDETGPLGGLLDALRSEGKRPLHIHATVTADGCLPLTTQIYFDGDPLVDSAVEGAIPAGAVRTTTLHDDLRRLTHDFVLRPDQRP